jgi:hypothetical protein
MNDPKDSPGGEAIYCDDLLQVDVLLQGGFTVELHLHADDPLLAQILSSFSSTPLDNAKRIFRVDTNAEASSIIFRASDVVGIRTTPPVAFIPQTLAPFQQETPTAIKHASWLLLESFLARDLVTSFHSFLGNERNSFCSSAERLENVQNYSGGKLAALEAMKRELLSELTGRIEEILDEFGLDIFACEFNCELCAYVDGGSTGPKIANNPECHGQRVLEFLYFIFEESLEIEGSQVRIYDLSLEESGTRIGSIAVELPIRSNAIVIYPSNFHFAVGPIHLKLGKVPRMLYMLRGCLSIAA